MAQPANHAGARPQPLSHPGTPTPTSASSTQQRSMGGLVLPGQNSQGGWQNVQRPAPQQLGSTPNVAALKAAASGAAGATTPSEEKTDFDAINDAVGMSGVDIAAEEELSRQANNRQQAAAAAAAATARSQDRPRVPEFVDRKELTTMVQHIAASYQLKTLEPAILEVLNQAAEARVHALLAAAVSAKNHRLASSHLRPPPFYPSLSSSRGKRKRSEGGDDGDEAAGEGKRKPMYEQVVYDDPERILGMMSRVEAEEESTARKARLERDMKEGDAKLPNGGASTPGFGDGGSTPSTPGAGGDGAKGTKDKKVKKQGPGQTAKNMSEDARARLSNQTAMRSVGGPARYSWLSGGVGASTPGTPSPLGAANSSSAGGAGGDGTLKGLPAPKFQPQPAGSSLKSSFLASASSLPRPGLPPSSSSSDPLSRLSGPLPGPHDAVGGRSAQGRPEAGNVGIRDAVFALERERGTGAGRGTGTRALMRSWATRSY